MLIGTQPCHEVSEAREKGKHIHVHIIIDYIVGLYNKKAGETKVSPACDCTIKSLLLNTHIAHSSCINGTSIGNAGNADVVAYLKIDE